MEGWRPVEDLIRWGFAHAPVVMADEAHDPFVIDQTVTVDFTGEPRPWVRELLASVGETLAAHGGAAGILCDQAPPPLDCTPGVDAVVVSADNELTR